MPTAKAPADHSDPASASAAARRAGTVTFRLTSTRQKHGFPAEPLLSGDGALDLTSRAGRMSVDFGALLNWPTNEPDIVRVWWDEATLNARGSLDIRNGTGEPRRTSGIGRMADEPPALLAVLASARVKGAGRATQIDGRPVTRFALVLSAAAAKRARVPADPALDVTKGLQLTVWIDGAGLPVRLAYQVTLPPMKRVKLPARTTRVIYDFGAYGEPVDVGP